jgi:hypothetical protein
MIRKSTVAKAAEALTETADPADLVTLADLATEGFGYGSPYVTTPRDAIDALARQLADDIVIDDIGRRSVSRSAARALFTERREAEARQREAQRRREAELEEQPLSNPIRGGVPCDQIPDGVLPASAMLQAARDAQPKRRSVLEQALTNDDGITYHPVDREDES